MTLFGEKKDYFALMDAINFYFHASDNFIEKKTVRNFSLYVHIHVVITHIIRKSFIHFPFFYL